MSNHSFLRNALIVLSLFATASQAATSPALTRVQIRSANQIGNTDTNNLYWTSASGLIASSAKLDVTSRDLIDGDNNWPNIQFNLQNGPLNFTIRGNTISSAGQPLETAWNRPYYRIDLFFDGSDVAAIHGLISCDTSNLTSNPCSNLVPNPGYTTDALSATFANSSRVTLTQATWDYTATDRMSFGTLEPDRHSDRFGTFSLQVSTVPEPTSSAMLLAGLTIVAGAVRRRRQRGN